MTNFRNEKGDVTSDPGDIKKIKRDIINNFMK